MSDSAPDYANPLFWEKRYEHENGLFDWYSDMEDVFINHVTELCVQSPVLVVGCGNSRMSMNIEKRGIWPVVSTDISKSCCRKMAELHGGCYLPMDVRDLQFRNNSFPCVIDKGTLDAISCEKHYEGSVAKMMLEIARVLTIGGVFIQITGRAASGLSSLDRPDVLGWRLETTLSVELDRGTVTVLVFRKVTEPSKF